MLKKPTIMRLQDIVKQVRTAAPADAPDLHKSLGRLEHKIGVRVANPELPAHEKVKVPPRRLGLEIRKLQTAAGIIIRPEKDYATITYRRSKGASGKPIFDLGNIKRSVDRLNYYLALPGEDEPDVP